MTKTIAMLVACWVVLFLTVPTFGEEEKTKNTAEKKELKTEEKEKEKGPLIKTSKTPKGMASKIRVLLPQKNARLWFDKMLTKTGGVDRKFRSPALRSGKLYTYTLTAVWQEKGKQVSHRCKISFRAGQDVLVDLRR